MSSDNNSIINCQCYNNYVGIDINTGKNNEISSCRCYLNDYAGISINNHGDYNRISKCYIHSNINTGIKFTYADENIHLDRALELIEKAVQYKPNSGYIIDSLGWVYFKKNQIKAAIIELEKAEKLVPDDPIIAEHLGDAYLEDNKIHKALKMYRKALTFESEERSEKKKKALKEKILMLEKRLGD